MAEYQVQTYPIPEEKYRVVFVKGKRCSKCRKIRRLDEFSNTKNVCIYCKRRLRENKLKRELE